MRIVSILAILALLAIVFDQKWLGELVFFFIAGCALWGFGDFLKDVVLGQTTMTKGGRQSQLRKHLASLPPNFNPRYGTMRLRGKSHEECLHRGVMPTRPDDYFEQQMAKGDAEYRRLIGGHK